MNRDDVIQLIREYGGVGQIKDETDLNYWMRNKARIFGASPQQTGELPQSTDGGGGGGTGSGDRIYWTGEPGDVHIEGGPWVPVAAVPFTSERPFRIIGTGTMECRWVSDMGPDPDGRYIGIWRYGFNEGLLGNYRFLLYDKNTHAQIPPVDPDQVFPLPDDDPSHVRGNARDVVRYRAISNSMFGAQYDGFGDAPRHRRTLLFGDPSYGDLIWTPTPATSMRYQDGYAINEQPEMTYAAPGDYEIRLCVAIGADSDDPFVSDEVWDDVLVQPYVHVDWFKLHAIVEYIDEEE